LFAIGCTFAGLAITGCGDSYSTLRDRWDYYSLREVRTELPSLMDRQWARRRNYTPDEMLAVQPGGSQTLLIARVTRPPVYNDVAQLDEQVSHTFVIVLDEPVKAGQTYHITPDNGRLIEGTDFRPAWRPYRGLEGDVTILSVSKDAIVAAVRVSALRLKVTDPPRSMSGMHRYRVATGVEPELAKAQINFQGVVPAAGGQ
ncbi:MAG TPA: hypothetical protein PLS23_23110, partial [Phycisphaerae bacterium]|nr:hypothetical protein [Phycisphaerae bacterium]